MVSRPAPYLFLLTNFILKAAGADRWDGSDWNKLTKHFGQPVLLASTDSPFPLQITDTLLKCDTAGGSITLSLPPAVTSAGKFYFAIKIHASNSMTLSPDGSDLINNAGSISVTELYGWVLVWCDGATWWALMPAAPAAGTDEKMVFQKGGSQVGSQPRKGNFDASAFNLTEDAGNDRVNVTINFGTGPGTVCQGNDSRLSDARTALAHMHEISDLLNAGGAAGDMFYWDGTNIIRLPKGDNGKVLKMVSNLPAWDNDLAGGGGGGGGTLNVALKTNANYTLLDSDDIVHFSTGNTDRVLTLSAASSYSKKLFEVRKIDSGTGAVEIRPNGTNKIGLYNASIYLTKQDEAIVFYPDGTQWWVRP